MYGGMLLFYQKRSLQWDFFSEIKKVKQKKNPIYYVQLTELFRMKDLWLDFCA